MRVTEPVWASARPWTVTLSPRLIDVCARMLPRKTEPAFNVAELPTCQKTLHSCAPLIRFTELPTPAVSDESVWMMNTVLGIVRGVERDGAGQQQRAVGRGVVHAAGQA